MILGLNLDTVGTGGTVNVNGDINLGNVAYNGNANADLKALKLDANTNGGVFSLTFQFVPGLTLTQLAAKNADHKTSYSGRTIDVVLSLGTNTVP